MLAAASVLSVPSPRPVRAAEPASNDAKSDTNLVENEKARQTFKEGIAAFDRRDFEAARVAFLQTFALKPTAPVVRRNLGLAEIYSGHYLEGARRLGRVIHTTDEGTSMDRARMVESLKKAEAHLERVTVEVNVEGAQIQIGDVDLGQSPMRFAWYMEPGSYEVRISKAGFVGFSETRMARAGNAEHLRVNLRPVVVEEVAAPVPSEPVPEPVSPPPQVDQHSGPNPWVLAAGGVLTAGGLAAGLTLSLFAADNADKVQQLGDSLGDTMCRAPLSGECLELSDAAAAHDRQVRWATVSFALGAAAGVSTLLYALLSSSSSDHGTQGGAASPSLEARSVGVAVEDGGPRLLVTGTF
jgi:hypothetical protein